MTSTTGRHEISEQTDVLPRPRHAAMPPLAPLPPYVAPAPPYSALPPRPGPGYVAPPPPPARPAMRWSWLVVGLAVAVLAVAALVAVAGAHRTMTVHGTVTIYGMSGLADPGGGCSSTTYRGTTVSIYDATGALVGTSSLPGEGTARDTWSTYSSGYADSCEYAFTATGVASSSDYYRIAVGSGQNQGVSFTRDQLASGTAGVTLH